MKKMIFILMGLWMAVSQIQAQVTEFLVLEALISNHKTLSNKLRDRITVDGSLALLTDIVADSTDVYRDDIVTMQKRVEGALSGVQFASEIAYLTMTAGDVAQHLASAMDEAIRVSYKHPTLLEMTVLSTQEAGNLIGDIYKLVSMVAGGSTGVVLATNENRSQFCQMVRDKLMRLDNVARNMSQMAYMHDNMGLWPENLGITGYGLDSGGDAFEGTDTRAYEKTVDYIEKLINARKP